MSGHEPPPGLGGVVGRCELCDKTLDGPLSKHMLEAHADETLSCWSDPDTGCWTIFGYGDPNVWGSEGTEEG